MLQPTTIEQLLAVLTKSKTNFYGGQGVTRAYQNAVDQVRRDYDVTYQTIGDLCRRRLGLKNISEFHNLLEKWLTGEPMALMEVMLSKTSIQNRHKIREYFNSGGPSSVITNAPATRTEDETVTLRVSPDIFKKIKVLAIIDDKSLPEWLSECVRSVVEEQYKNWLAKEGKKQA